MAIKLIAFDMDDTLLLDDRTIGERTMRALRAAHEQGVRIVPATGRGKHSMWNYVEQIGVADAAICTNGAQVYDGAGRPIRERPVDLDLARQIVRFAKENGWYVQGYSEDDYFFEAETEETRLYARLANHMGRQVGDLIAYMQQPPFKMLFVQTDMEKMARLKAQAVSRFGQALCVFDSKPFYLEMTDHGATKGAAVLDLAERFGVLPGEVMCFGDSGNDLSMIECAGVGVVMGNARAEIHMENYVTVISIEAKTMADMIRHDILPAVSGYADTLCQRAYHKDALGVSCKYENSTAKELGKLTDALFSACDRLERDMEKLPADTKKAMTYCRDVVIPDMSKARELSDQLECITAADCWPFPVYSELLFST